MTLMGRYKKQHLIEQQEHPADETVFVHKFNSYYLMGPQTFWYTAKLAKVSSVLTNV